MRTVITHFFNEEYLLPWWLKHHTQLFEHGILIDHGSTDNSADICRQLAPGWRLVKSRLTSFDAWLTDLEVMNYEHEIAGWKIALNTTEFLISDVGLDEIERFMHTEKKYGIAASGMTMIDKKPLSEPTHELSLIEQKPWAIDDNRFGQKKWLRQILGYPKRPHRNRFYHCLPTGMYAPGRHWSFHPHSRVRTPNLAVLHFAYAPWNSSFIDRKQQIGTKLSDLDRKVGIGFQHMRNLAQLQKAFRRFDRLAFTDLSRDMQPGALDKAFQSSGTQRIVELPNIIP